MSGPMRFRRALASDAVRIDLPLVLKLNGASRESFLNMKSSTDARFSHIVIFWTDPAQPNAADDLIAGANQYLKDIPGVLQFHIGKMSPSPRPVVEQSYQVALNLIFPNKAAEQAYQVHPRHIEFVERVFKRTCKKVVIYDFE
jgi:hypothetical protein